MYGGCGVCLVVCVRAYVKHAMQRVNKDWIMDATVVHVARVPKIVISPFI